MVEMRRQHQSSHDLTELRTQNRTTSRPFSSIGVLPVIVMVDVALTSDGLGGLHVVSRHHSHENTGLLARQHSFRDFTSHWILESQERHQRKEVLHYRTLSHTLLILRVIRNGHVDVLNRLEVAVRERQHTQRLTSHRVDAVLHQLAARARTSHIARTIFLEISR